MPMVAAALTIRRAPAAASCVVREFLYQPITVGDMQPLKAHELLQKLSCFGRVMPVALELCDQLTLPPDMFVRQSHMLRGLS